MLINKNNIEILPSRVVILGGNGFVGSALTKHLQDSNIEVLSLSSKDIDLTSPESVTILKEILKPNDSVVFLSVIGPNRGFDTAAFIKNIQMAEVVANAVNHAKCKQLIYLSSDAVYDFQDHAISEETKPAPDSLYGIMHLSREFIIKSTIKPLETSIVILRATQIYGPNATHNAYGPNRLIKSALNDRKIELFGHGEDTRDFVYIHDVVRLISLIINYNSYGLINVASGNSISYLELAKIINRECCDNSATVSYLDRAVPLKFREFAINSIYNTFKNFIFTDIIRGVKFFL